MRITFDSEVDALTIVVSYEPVERTLDVGDGRFIDVDADENLVAMEIVGASNGFLVHDLIDRFDLEPLLLALGELVARARHAKEEAVCGDPALREALLRA